MHCLRYWHRWRVQRKQPKILYHVKGFKVRVKLTEGEAKVFVASTGENPHYPAWPEKFMFVLPADKKPKQFEVWVEETPPNFLEETPTHVVYINGLTVLGGYCVTAKMGIASRVAKGNFICGP